MSDRPFSSLEADHMKGNRVIASTDHRAWNGQQVAKGEKGRIAGLHESGELVVDWGEDRRFSYTTQGFAERTSGGDMIPRAQQVAHEKYYDPKDHNSRAHENEHEQEHER